MEDNIMVTQLASSTSFWQRLKRGHWGQPVLERIEAALDDLTRRLRADDTLAAINVFGSFARGDYGRKSDLDLLFVLHRLPPDERRRVDKQIIHVIGEVEAGYRL